VYILYIGGIVYIGGVADGLRGKHVATKINFVLLLLSLSLFFYALLLFSDKHLT
jgi:hypothetical protein